jgi:glycerol-3-phosphate dehydrogenase (NAD(P)+)
MAVSVLGAGAWGTALAHALAARSEVCLWARDPLLAASVQQERANARYLPGVHLAQGVRCTADLAQAVEHAHGGLLVAAVPTSGLRPLLAGLRPLAPAAALAWLSKGLERGTGHFAHEIAAAELPAVASGPLSGPSFAQEVAAGRPTALVIAGSPALCGAVTQAVHAPTLRVYSSPDIVGVEVGGAVKNVLAIATGICDALDLGLNARAALMTRGLSETRRLALALGAQGDTLMGLAGLGDLVLTCTGALSRNRKVGLALGQGRTLEQALAELGHVAEGVWSARPVVERARRLGVEMPICEAVLEVLESGCSARVAVEQLLAREPRAE